MVTDTPHITYNNALSPRGIGKSTHSKMPKITPRQVKEMVTEDLKKRDITYIQIADIIGITRQTVSNILNENAYFSPRQATLFALAFGYDRRFLTDGEGQMISNESDYGIGLLNESRARIIKEISRCSTLTTRFMQLNNDPKYQADKEILSAFKLITTTLQYIELRDNPELIDVAAILIKNACDELEEKLPQQT